MNFNEITRYISRGSIVRSKECEYKSVHGVMYWRWIGEEEWTCPVNDREKQGDWEVVR